MNTSAPNHPLRQTRRLRTHFLRRPNRNNRSTSPKVSPSAFLHFFPQLAILRYRMASSHLHFCTSFPSLLLSPRYDSLISRKAALKTVSRSAGFGEVSVVGTSSVEIRWITKAAAVPENMIVFPSEEDLAESVPRRLAIIANQSILTRGFFTLALSGGSVIKPLRRLLGKQYKGQTDWSKWHVFWVDERVVPKDHDDSNYKLAYDVFLSELPIPSSQVHSINDALSAEGAAEDYEARIKHLMKTNVIASSSNGLPKFDLILLGMGPDGHVASLFPGHPLLKEKEKWVAFIKDSPKPPSERITFTFPVINSSSYIALVVSGASKAGAVHAAIGKSQNSDKLPVQMVSPDEFVWLVDKDATSLL